jgi:MinD-like ATPase involved in chromosome partitioning or flagellar assembly
VLHSLLISDDVDATDLLSRIIRGSGQITLDRFFCPSPTHYALATTLNTLALDVVFLDVSFPDRAFTSYEHIKQINPAVPVIGFSATELAFTASGGPTGFSLSLPYSTQDLIVTVRDAISASRPLTLENVIAILPSKAGSGSSTIAMNLANQLASSFNKSVVVMDCDLRSGTMAESLGLVPQVSLAETLTLADMAVTLIWPRHVRRKDGVEFLLSSRAITKAAPAWHSYHHLLPFLSARYDHVLIDLPELTDDATEYVLKIASRVFIATTPDVLAVTLAAQRIHEIEAAGVDPAKIRILLNAWQPGDLASSDISEALDHPVQVVFPKDDRAVGAAIANHTFVSSRKLAQAYRSFAGSLTRSADPPARSNVIGSLLNSLLSRKAISA